MSSTPDPTVGSRLAHAFWPRFYRAIGLAEALTRRYWRRAGIGNVVEVVIPGRRTGEPRSILLGLLTTHGRTYLGHPDDACDWTRNLDAAGGSASSCSPTGRARRSAPFASIPDRSGTP